MNLIFKVYTVVFTLSIKTIDGSNWYNQLRLIKPQHKLKPLNLFMYEPSFETYLKEITDEF